jgi:arylsulfatase
MANMTNLKRDPFETAVGEWQKAALANGGALAGPVTSFLYDWNMLSIGQVDQDAGKVLRSNKRNSRISI